jgi:trimeric autotransporter adhesin
MSTKTLRKRIALVAVAALGFGMLSTVSASAAAVTVGATASISTDVSSVTLIPAGATPATTEYGAFEVSLTNSSGYAAPLQTGETMTATVIAPVNGRTLAASTDDGTGGNLPTDITAFWSKNYTPTTRVITTKGNTATLFAQTNEAVLGGNYDDMSLSDNLRGGTDATHTGYTTDESTATATYALGVYATADADLIGAGFYSIVIRVLDTNGNTRASTTVKFQVATKAGSGAVLTAAVTGSHATPTVGGRIAYTTTNNISATLTDANGGRVVELANASPTLSATVKDTGSTATPAVFTTDSMTMSDTGTALTTTTATTVVKAVFGNGVYHATQGVLTGLAGTGTFTVQFGDAKATASVVMTGTTASQWMNTSVSATGRVANATTATNFDVPLSTKAASVTATAYSAADATASTTTAVGAATMYYTLSYSGCVLGDMSPAATTTLTKVTANANGQHTIDITNANPIDGCAATVVFTGATLVTTPTTGSLTRVITWSKPVPTSVVVSPAGGYSALAASTHKFTWTIADQFSAPVVGSTVQFTMSGANKPATGSSVPSAITDANGQVSYTFTDAAGVPDSTTLGSTTVGLTSVGTTPFAKGSIKVTYVATLPAIASLYSTYTATNAAGTTITGLVPTTAIGGTTGVLTSTADQIDSAKTVTGATTGAWVQLNFQARKAAATTGTSGVPTTVTVTGAQLIGNDGKLGTTVTVYANENVHVLGTKAGTATVTATNGTLTSTATINFINASSDARVLKLTEAAGLVTASVTDAFGSAVKGVEVDVVGSGGAWLGNGATSAAFKTATDGTVTFSVTGSGTVSASLATTFAKASFLAGAGNTTGTVVTTGAPAGVRSASVATTGNNATADSAQAAADAAAEATDAANAATDAANAAAEAADAATAAAQDAADAVAALSTQVSEMVNALKKQITALTNLVIKIQKKVRA